MIKAWGFDSITDILTGSATRDMARRLREPICRHVSSDLITLMEDLSMQHNMIARWVAAPVVAVAGSFTAALLLTAAFAQTG